MAAAGQQQQQHSRQQHSRQQLLQQYADAEGDLMVRCFGNSVAVSALTSMGSIALAALTQGG